MSVPPRPLLGLCLLSAALVASLLAFGATDRVTTAPGSVRPAGEARPLQVTRAGRIHDWLPLPHASVRRGELLGRLDTREEALRLHAMTLALAGFGADEARLTALLAEFGPETCPGTACAEALPLDAQHARERTLEREERAAARARLASLHAERAALLTRRGGLEGQARWLRPACHAHRELARRGGIAEVAHWESERRCAEDAGALATLEAEAATLTTRLAGQTGEERRRRAAVRQQWGRALAAAGRERQALVAERALLEEQIARAWLRAPADGSLHCERPDYTDVWVPAGATLCHVVPEPARAEVIAELAEQDHAGVHPGQAVSLRVLALPWLRHGVLPGRVAGIAPDTRPPPVPGGAPVYLVTVSPEPGHALAAELAPGMRVEVDFHRGREPLWRWLLGPLAEGWLRAGREP